MYFNAESESLVWIAYSLTAICKHTFELAGSWARDDADVADKLRI